MRQPKHSRRLGLGIVLLLAGSPLQAREKTDLVFLLNGDRLTGEVKGLEQSRLSLKTDDMGTVGIEWDKVDRLISALSFEVELETGEKFFGTLGGGSEPGTIEVSGESETASLEMSSVVRIVPIESGFWQRLDGSLDLGFSATRANRAIQLTLGAEGRYRTRKLLRSTRLSSTLSERDDADRTRRQSLEGQLVRFLSNRRLFIGVLQFQENEELDLELRALAGAGFGRYVIQTNRMRLNLYGGLAANRERFKGLGSADTTGEAVAGLQFAYFKLDEPETDVSVSFTVYPSLSTSGRVRAELDARLRHELVKDFFWSISVYNSFDSEPPLEGFATNDWGLSTSVGWSF